MLGQVVPEDHRIIGNVRGLSEQCDTQRQILASGERLSRGQVEIMITHAFKRPHAEKEDSGALGLAASPTALAAARVANFVRIQSIWTRCGENRRESPGTVLCSLREKIPGDKGSQQNQLRPTVRRIAKCNGRCFDCKKTRDRESESPENQKPKGASTTTRSNPLLVITPLGGATSHVLQCGKMGLRHPARRSK